MGSNRAAGAQLLPRSYPEAEHFLLDLVNYEQLPPPMKGDSEGWHLKEFSRLLAKMGNPQAGLRILHIAGTKGKGSTTRMAASLLSAIGFRRVGAFTSPHIESFRERICINGRPIAPTDFVRALRAVCEANPIRPGEGFRTTFEVLTAMAFWHFHRNRCDAVVLETGLGGRLDSTNVALARVALITTIGFEHQRVLGSTLTAIAAEKAGIIKPGTGMAVLGPQLPRRQRVIEKVVRRQARKTRVPLACCKANAGLVRQVDPQDWGFRLHLQVNGADLAGVRLHALGRHQIQNLHAAWAGVHAFCQLLGVSPRSEQLKTGIERFRAPGRLELVRPEPPILADAAHCPISAKAAVGACAEHFPGCPLLLVLGLMRDKKPQPILKSLSEAGIIREVFAYTPPSPRARDAGDMARLAKAWFPRVHACRDIMEAMAEADALQKKNPGSLILSTGTAYSIAQVRAFAKSRGA